MKRIPFNDTRIPALTVKLQQPTYTPEERQQALNIMQEGRRGRVPRAPSAPLPSTQSSEPSRSKLIPEQDRRLMSFLREARDAEQAQEEADLQEADRLKYEQMSKVAGRKVLWGIIPFGLVWLVYFVIVFIVKGFTDKD